jgi:hypothetical protein
MIEAIAYGLEYSICGVMQTIAPSELGTPQTLDTVDAYL